MELTASASSRPAPDDFWQPAWLPIFAVDGGTVLALDLAASDGTIAPILTINWQDVGGSHFAAVVARSLGEYVATSLDAIDAGRFAYDCDEHFWVEADES